MKDWITASANITAALIVASVILYVNRPPAPDPFFTAPATKTVRSATAHTSAELGAPPAETPSLPVKTSPAPTTKSQQATEP